MNLWFAKLFFGWLVWGEAQGPQIKGEKGKREEEINEAIKALFAFSPLTLFP